MKLIDTAYPPIPWPAGHGWDAKHHASYAYAVWHSYKVSVWTRSRRLAPLRAMLAVFVYRLWKVDSMKPMPRLYMWLRCI